MQCTTIYSILYTLAVNVHVVNQVRFQGVIDNLILKSKGGVVSGGPQTFEAHSFCDNYQQLEQPK